MTHQMQKSAKQVNNQEVVNMQIVNEKITHLFQLTQFKTFEA